MPRCRGTNQDGSACGAPERLVDAESGFCYAHGPEAKERLSEAGKKGAEATARKLRAGGIEEGELGELETHADAKRWLKTIGAAVCSGRLNDRAAQAAIRAVSEWVKAHADEATATVVEELEAEVKRLREDIGAQAPRLRTVAGN